MHIIPRILAGAVAAFLLRNPVLLAADFTWDGGNGLSENWTTAGNWAGDLAPPLDGTADLIFSGTSNLAPNANVDWSIRSLSFAGGAASFGVQGNTLTLGAGGIVNADDSVQTIQNDLVLAASQTFSTASTGSLRIDGNINTNGQTLSVAAATDFITLAGAITGGGGLVVSGGDSLVLAGGASNTYTGGTTINGSIFLAKTGGAMALPGAVIVGGAGQATLAIGFDEQIGNASSITVNAGGALSLGSGVTETIGALALSGGAQVNNGTLNVGTVSMFGGRITTGASGKLVLSGAITAVSAGLQPATISGNLNLGGAARTITVVDGLAARELEIQAAISNGALVKDGEGGLRIMGVQNYTSLTVRAGAVDLETMLGGGVATVDVSPVTGTATVDFKASQRLAALTIGNGGVVTISPLGSFFDSQDSGSDLGTNEPVFRSAVAQSVPEPSSGWLVVMSAVVTLAGRRRK